MKKPILCLDFDGVLHSYVSGWKGAHCIPDPMTDGGLLFLLQALKTWDVVVHSSRARYWGGIRAMRAWLKEQSGNCWYDSPAGLGTENVRFVRMKPPAVVTLDDRALTFEGSWPSMKTIAAFQPWNKRRSG